MYPSYFIDASTSSTALRAKLSFPWGRWACKTLGLFSASYRLMLLETFSPERLCNFLASGEFGFNFCFFKRSNSFVVVSFFKRYFCQSSSETIPISLPFSVRRMSALSSLKISLYSALLVNILYGSFVPRLTRSSIKTPI